MLTIGLQRRDLFNLKKSYSFINEHEIKFTPPGWDISPSQVNFKRNLLNYAISAG